MTMARTSVNFEVEIQVEERSEELYAATIMPFHVTGYSDTFDGAINRAKEGLHHLLRAYETDGNLTSFLDESDVQYTINDDAAAADSAVRRVKEQIAYAGAY